MGRGVNYAVVLAALAVPGGCGDVGSSAAVQSGAQVEIGVQALSLPDATDVLYDIAIINGNSETVWSETSISSNDYGAIDGSGSFGYLAPCDADAPAHTVELSVRELTGLTTDEWVDPGTLSKAFTCAEDTTTPVDFDVTLAQDADEGFVVVTIDINGVSCNAALDCESSTGQDLLVAQDAAGNRLPSATVSFACSGGSASGQASDTWLYMNDVVVTCTDGTYAVDPEVEGLTIVDDPNSLVESVLVSRGAVDNTSSGEFLYWNVTVGMDVLTGGDDCTLTTKAATSDSALPAFTTPSTATYPYVEWNVPLRTAGADVCTQHAVAIGGSGVTVEATPVGSPETFDYEFSN